MWRSDTWNKFLILSVGNYASASFLFQIFTKVDAFLNNFLILFYLNYWIVILWYFLQADNLVNIVDVDSTSVVLSHRLNPLNSPPVEKLPSNHLTLQEILIMGNCCDQVPVKHYLAINLCFSCTLFMLLLSLLVQIIQLILNFFAMNWFNFWHQFSRKCVKGILCILFSSSFTS